MTSFFTKCEQRAEAIGCLLLAVVKIMEGPDAVVLAYKEGAVQPYITWIYSDHGAVGGFNHGHYTENREAAEEDFVMRSKRYGAL